MKKKELSKVFALNDDGEIDDGGEKDVTSLSS
jgi:hypothetical protein